MICQSMITPGLKILGLAKEITVLYDSLMFDKSTLTTMLIIDIEEKQSDLTSVIKANSIDGVKSVGHKLRGNSAALALGFEAINRIGEALESASVTGDWDQIRQLLIQLTAVLEAIRTPS